MLKGRKGIIFGVANKRSIAWAIARKLHEAGMELVFTYAIERLKKNVEELAKEIGSKLILQCDVTNEEEIQKVFDTVKNEWGSLDTLVHSVAFANREDLDGEFTNTSQGGFQTALTVSAYSLTALCRGARPLFSENGSVIAMTYIGGERVIKNYNVMGVAKAALESSIGYLAADLGPAGVRVNAISAGPIKTLAAKGISGFGSMLETYREKAPLRRNVDASDVGNVALFLASDLSRAITAEVIHVDSGYHILGL